MNDEQWFESLWRQHAGEVWAFAARRVPREDADDVVAETFLVAWRRRDERGGKPWLLAVARNVIGTRYRTRDRQGRLLARLVSVPVDPGLDPAEDLGMGAALSVGFDQLAPEELEAILLVGWDDLTPKDAATVAGCSRAAMRMRLLRARRKLTSSFVVAQPAAEERQP
jgi:RNA polymerase sigma-70 factor (ECF subfamily)